MKTNYSLKMMQILFTIFGLVIMYALLGASQDIQSTVTTIISYIP